MSRRDAVSHYAECKYAIMGIVKMLRRKARYADDVQLADGYAEAARQAAIMLWDLHEMWMRHIPKWAKQPKGRR